MKSDYSVILRPPRNAALSDSSRVASYSTKIRHSRLKYDFLRMLRVDLAQIGISMSLRKRGMWLWIEQECAVVRRDRIIGSMYEESKRRLEKESAFVRKLVSNGIENQFVDGASLSIESINPVIHFCSTRGDHEIFRFCRLLQAVPAPRLLYRQIAAIVKDHGQPGTPIIGVFGLSSAVYSLGSGIGS